MVCVSLFVVRMCSQFLRTTLLRLPCGAGRELVVAIMRAKAFLLFSCFNKVLLSECLYVFPRNVDEARV